MINKLIRKSKKTHYKQFFAKNINDIKKTWKEVNNILNRNKKHNQNIQLQINRTLTSDNKYIGNSFNHYFTNIADSLSKKIPKTNNAYQDYLKNPNEHSIYLNETTPREITLVINSLKSSNTSDIYGITSKFIILSSTAIVNNLSILFNKSLHEGTFPNLFKTAKVIPIFKNGSPLSVSNYRPISLLPIFSKIFERLIQ